MPSYSALSKIDRTVKIQQQIFDSVFAKGEDRNTFKVKKTRERIKQFFLPFQKEWHDYDGQIAIAEKSRQIGWTYVTSHRSVIRAIKGDFDTYYSSYNKDSCRNYIRFCAGWVRAYDRLIQLKYNKRIIDINSINVFSIDLLNGKRIEAIPGNAENIRSKSKAEFILDEFAFRLEDAEEIKKAVLAILNWNQNGAGIKVISTHNGDDTDFNKWIKEVKADPSQGKVFRVTFKEAIAQGLFKKICEVRQELWTPEKEREWIANIYNKYKENASEELDVIPRKYDSKNILKREYFGIRKINPELIKNYSVVRYFDLASTVKKSSYYTATIAIAVSDDPERDGFKFIIIDARAEKLTPDLGDAWIAKIVKEDGYGTTQLIEKEPGSTGDKYIAYMQKRLTGYYIEGYPPTANKVLRSLPLVSLLKCGDLVIADKEFYLPKGNNEPHEYLNPEELINILCQFGNKPEPLVTDLVDCLSGSIEYAQNQLSDWV